MQKKAARMADEEAKKDAQLKARAEKMALMDEEEKQMQKAVAAKKPAGKKAKQYDAAEAQKKALMKQLAKMSMGTSCATEGEEDDGAQMIEEGAEGTIEEVVVLEQEQMQKQKSSGSNGASAAVAVDRHPEKRMKAAYVKFEEERLPELKAEYPTLKLS